MEKNRLAVDDFVVVGGLRCQGHVLQHHTVSLVYNMSFKKGLNEVNCHTIKNGMCINIKAMTKWV